MPLHTLAQGECARSIAAQRGTPWAALWEHPENAELRARRPDPAVLQPGDVLFVPDPEPAPRPCAVQIRNRYTVSGRTTLFRLRLLREGDAPRAAQAYQLCVDGFWQSGSTDAEGWLEARIPCDARRGELVLPAHDGQSVAEAEERFELAFGHLDPSDEISGAQGRLRNLGFAACEVDGVPGPETEDALRLFQATAGLEETGRLDPPTADALRARHGS
ncbi:MAG TPA: peptidoglycan-binding domain-containing protein [Longimicrobium sp.]|jgi:N-acetylmuramoyl-L-alanine amidase